MCRDSGTSLRAEAARLMESAIGRDEALAVFEHSKLADSTRSSQESKLNILAPFAHAAGL